METKSFSIYTTVKYSCLLLLFILLGCKRNSESPKGIESKSICDTLRKNEVNFAILNETVVIKNMTVVAKNIKIVDISKYKTIKESCIRVVFNDSIVNLWNKSCAYDILREYYRFHEKRLEFNFFNYYKGDLYHLSFAKFLNDSSLIDKYDFVNGFFIIEETQEYSSKVTNFSLIKHCRHNNDFLECYMFQYNHRTQMWNRVNLNEPKINNRMNRRVRFLKKIEIYKWFSIVKYNRINPENTSKTYSTTSNFVVSFFELDSVNSYVFDFAPNNLYSRLKKILS